MKSKILTFLTFLASFCVAYTFYAFTLQTPTFFSRSRLAISGLLWLVLFAGAYALVRWEKLLPRSRATYRGILALFLLFNLFAAGRVFRIPYTYILLPVRTVQIQPLPDAQPIEIISFSTELVDSNSLDNFQYREGWEQQDRRIIQKPGRSQPLIWQGRPGQSIQIQFATCPGCGQVQVHWGAQQMQVVDLEATTAELSPTRHDYPSLLPHKFLNLLFLELSLLSAAIAMYSLGWFLLSRLRTNPAWASASGAKSIGWLPYVGLAGLTLLIYALKLRPILFNDDWCIVNQMHFDQLQPFMLAERRPLNWFLPALFDRVLPLHLTVEAIFVILLLLLALSAALYYVLLKHLTAGQRWFAFLAACLLLAYPNDYTRLYFVMLDIRLNFALTLVLMLLFVKFLKDDHWISGVLAIPLFAISLLMYEGQLGIALLWPALLLVFFRRPLSLRKGLLLGGYYAVAGVFLLWKLVLQPTIYRDSKLESILISPGELLERGLNTFKTIMAGFRFPYPDGSWLTPLNIVLLIGALLGAVGIYWLSGRLYREKLSNAAGTPDRLHNGQLLLMGALLWLAGYFPILLNYPPNIYGHLSRVNLYSLPGAVLVLLTLLHIVFSAMGRTPALAARLTIIAALGFFLVGAVVQLQTQEAYNRSWQEARAFYQELFHVVPALQEETQIIFELSGYDLPSDLYRPLFSSSWEAWCALRTLYDQPDLQVSYVYDRLIVPPFPGFNILTSTLETDTRTPIIDPDRLLILGYDRQDSRLEIRTDAGKYVPADQASQYDPNALILPQTNTYPSRDLVK